jgi:hypothetical protein
MRERMEKLDWLGVPVHLPGVPEDIHPGGVRRLHEGRDGEVVQGNSLTVERWIPARVQLQLSVIDENKTFSKKKIVRSLRELNASRIVQFKPMDNCKARSSRSKTHEHCRGSRKA